MAKRLVDESLLSAIAALGLIPDAMVRDLLASRRGRPPKDEAAYRRLQLWWRSFRRLNATLTEEQALKRFLRVRGDAVRKELGLSRATAESLRKAVARGGRETERVHESRRQRWRLIPAGLAHAVHGRNWMLVTDPNEAAILKGAQARALLHDGAPVGFVNITVTSTK